MWMYMSFKLNVLLTLLDIGTEISGFNKDILEIIKASIKYKNLFPSTNYWNGNRQSNWCKDASIFGDKHK